MTICAHPSISGVVLAGGRGQRMGGEDKGWLDYGGKPLVHHVAKRLAPQVDRLIINANRNITRYQRLGYKVVSDDLADFCGPLAGMLAAMKAVDTDYILTAPCDSPFVSMQLRQRLMEALLFNAADIAVAHDGKAMQPVFCLIACRLVKSLQGYLDEGGRKIDSWFTKHPLAVVDFSDQADSFVNFNYPDDLARHPLRVASSVPLLGLAATSGTGKTTLLKKLIPLLALKGLRVAVIKHAHHAFDIDLPGKDSYELRQKGAQQVLVSSSRLCALMMTHSPQAEPCLTELVARLDHEAIDVILVEGFKAENIAKIELYRPSLNRPPLYHHDPHIIAVATDAMLTINSRIDLLDLNDIEGVADYVQRFIKQARLSHG